MNKSKKTFKESIINSGKYLREVSVVVIGVAITLSVSYWIGINNEKRDMALHLRAIKMELKENTGYIEILVNSLKFQCRYADYLQSRDKKSLDKDTLNSYYLLCYTPPENYTFIANAFEMFKNSGTMRLMSDKELLMGIWNVYDYLTYLKEAIDEHNRLKWNFIEKEISLFDVNGEKIELNIIPMYDFYKKTNASNNLLKISERVLRKTHELSVKLAAKEMEASKLKTLIVADEDLDKYLGVYSSCDQFSEKLTITKENKLLIGQLTEQRPFPLTAVAENKFEFGNAIFEFNLTDKTLVVKNDGDIINFIRE
jgi:hypothetical protein